MNTLLEKVKEKNRINIKITREPLDLKWSLLAIAFLSVAGFFVQSFIQNGFFSLQHFVYALYPVVVLFNVLPVFLTISLFYFVFGRIWIGAAVAYVPLIILNLANYYKICFRDEPLKMSDLMLVSEMRNITQNYELKLTLGIVFGVVLAAFSVYVAIKYFRSEKLKWTVKTVGVAATLCCALLSYNFVYTNRQLYENIPTFAVEYHDADMVNHHGMLYSLLISTDSATYNMPEGYSDEVAEELLAQSASASVIAEGKEKINVIAIMGEAFFDVTRGGVAQFEEGMNPYANYHRLKSEGYSGKLTVLGFGGSTESTEFEFLTGASQYLLDSSVPTAYKTYVTQPAYSLAQYFKDNGYETVAIHPGYGWFYNRQNAYKYIGFDRFVSREQMDADAPQIYGYIADSYATKQILDNYEKHYENNPDTPYFNFTVTIQNHGPYPGEDVGRDIIYTRPEGISDENYWVINNYLTGVRDTDRLLGEICDFAESREEPVTVLFFGDHLPYLDEKIECFDALGYNISHRNEEGIENKYNVEYLMWSNDAARKIIGKVKRGEGPEMSAGFLGAEFLDYLGVEKPAYFEFVGEVRKKVNVISPNYYKSGDEKFYSPGGENAEILNKYRILQYYNFRRYNKD